MSIFFLSFIDLRTGKENYKVLPTSLFCKFISEKAVLKIENFLEINCKE